MKNKNKEGGYVSVFFSDDINKAVESMSNEEMNQLLNELEDTNFWVAISKYIQERLIVANRSLQIIDPVQNPATIARTQGIMSGLLDLHNMVKGLKEAIKTAEKKAQLKVEVSPSQEAPENDESAPMY